MSKSIIPPTGDFGLNWPGSFNIPQGGSGLISAAGWTYKNEGFIQQTFLGASIRSFNINAGFGDTTSTLSAQLVEDEYNKSDGTGLGLGDDVYHNGDVDNFIPPAVGSPVFFKFGKTFATVEQAWRKLYDSIYNVNTLDNDDEPVFTEESEIPIPLEENQYLDISQTNIEEEKFVFVQQDYLDTTGYNGDRYDPPNETARGSNHILFAGILQSYVETKGSDGNPLYSVQVVDPREILSNTVVILNNYAGSVFNNKNYLNVYGFLEYDPSDQFLSYIAGKSIFGFNIGPVESVETWVITNPLSSASEIDTTVKTDNKLQKIVNTNTGAVFYYGNDMYRLVPSVNFSSSYMAEFFPMTGQGFSRRSEQGIPWYRVRQGLEALLNTKGFLPPEYVDKGFGGPINFRGYNYVVDFSGIPIDQIPQMYFLNFDQIDLLSLCQELCDVLSHDLFISLLPIINHPASEFLFEYNKYYSEVDPSKLIAGIIRVDAIDRSKSPKIGAIKEYLDSLESKGVYVENQDLGYELSNVTTDKIVAGAQEVEMYYFNNNKDRDNLQFRKMLNAEDNSYKLLQGNQWLLETSLNQQILPFYGFLGKDTPTIPLGFGAYQQILLDTSALDAYGVGNYYIATEMELRAALSSYEDWSRFLVQYNESYIEEIGDDQVFWETLNDPSLNQEEFGVAVPRCVFVSEKNFVDANGLPASPCCPPYGYPLYYKRAEKIGIPEAGIILYSQNAYQLITKYTELREQANSRDELLISRGRAKNKLDELRKMLDVVGKSEENEDLNKSVILLQNDLDAIEKEIDKSEEAKEASVVLRNILDSNQRFIFSINSLASTHMKNAKKVYEFIRNVAEKHLGKTFLIKIPKQCNVNYNNEISLFGNLKINNIFTGPYGFRPVPINSNINEFNFDATLSNYRNQISPDLIFEHYLDNSNPYKYTYGALKCNFNPLSDNWEFNYKPESQGGFFNYALYDRNLAAFQLRDIATTRVPFAQAQLLAPIDLTNFEESSRIKTYVRFDHSQFLDFSNIGKENLCQQIITAEGFVPDILEELNNINPDSRESFEEIQKRLEYETKPLAVAFVKCEIDEQFYLLPRLVRRTTPVFARDVSKNYIEQSPIVVKTTDIDGCTKIDTVGKLPIPHYTVPSNGGVDGTQIEILDFERYYSLDLNGEIINTEKEALSSDHVYAIITLPGKVIPTTDQRYLDGTYQAMNGTSIKHAMCIDVVHGAPGFNKPQSLTLNSNIKLPCNNFSFDKLTEAQRAQRDINSSIGFANPNISIGFTNPSPVYPDLVALPLMSLERCYGPWISSAVPNGTDGRVRYSDIGGKVEFVKDENLAPWNYAGYQLMNEAGFLQAQFSNSLLLFSERGGFIVPDIPEGVNLAQPLDGVGPLITSISVNIDSSVKTTVRMDLYTSRFGKLQKQKEDAIAMIVRERQKIIDQNNSMIRKGVLKRTGSGPSVKQSLDVYAGGSQIKKLIDQPVSQIVASVEKHSDLDVNGRENITWYNQVSMQKDGEPETTAAAFDDYNTLRKKFLGTAGRYLGDMYHAVSMNPAPNMPSVEYIYPQTQEHIFKT